MPSHSVSCLAAFRRLRTRDVWLLIAAAWAGLLLTAAGCRDTREDASYCKSCSTDPTDGIEETDGMSSSGQESSLAQSAAPASGANMSQASGVSTGSAPMTAGQTGQTGQNGQAGTAAGPGRASAGTSAANSPAAGSRASAGNMRDAGTDNGSRAGMSGGSDPAQGGRGSAANGGSVGMLDAAAQEPPPADAGRTEPLPCNGTCPAERPVCDESSGSPRCVQCTREDDHTCIGETMTCDPIAMKCVQCTPEDAHHCGGDTHVCNQNNRCVVCTNDRPESCPAAQPLCEDEKRCVECMPGRVDSCPIGRNLCNSDGRCIECTDNTHCLDGARPRCDRTSNACVGCENNNDCGGRFPQAPYCDKSSRQCVACTSEGEPTCGPGNFCDPSTHTCAPGRPTQAECTRCNKDAECGPSPEIALCVDNYCFAAALGGACQPGFTVQPVAGHNSTPYCLPPSTSSCPAISNALAKKSCTKQDECGKNGVCVMPANLCSLRCTSPQECPAPMTCQQGTCSGP